MPRLNKPLLAALLLTIVFCSACSPAETAAPLESAPPLLIPSEIPEQPIIDDEPVGTFLPEEPAEAPESEPTSDVSSEAPPPSDTYAPDKAPAATEAPPSQTPPSVTLKPPAPTAEPEPPSVTTASIPTIEPVIADDPIPTPEPPPESTPTPEPPPTPESTPTPTPTPTATPTPEPTPEPTPTPTPTPEIGLTSITVETRSSSVIVDGKSLPDEAQKLIDLVNKERESLGLSSLSNDSTLFSTSLLRTAEISVNWSHTRPNGLRWTSVSELINAENLAYGYDTALDVFDAWMLSDGHKDNILGADFTRIGVTALRVNGTVYWVQHFGI